MPTRRHEGLAASMPVFLPSLALATDNAAMIGAAGLRNLRAGVTATLDLNAQAALENLLAARGASDRR